MKFRLVYRGPLRTNANVRVKHALRREFHGQLRELVNRPAMAPFARLIATPLTNLTTVKVGAYNFLPLITKRLQNVATLNITMLTP